MRIAPSTPNPGLIRVSSAMGVAEVALAVALVVAVALAEDVEEGVSVNVVGMTDVMVEACPFVVETNVVVKLLVVTGKDVEEEFAEAEEDALAGLVVPCACTKLS